MARPLCLVLLLTIFWAACPVQGPPCPAPNVWLSPRCNNWEWPGEPHGRLSVTGVRYSEGIGSTFMDYRNVVALAQQHGYRFVRPPPRRVAGTNVHGNDLPAFYSYLGLVDPEARPLSGTDFYQNLAPVRTHTPGNFTFVLRNVQGQELKMDRWMLLKENRYLALPCTRPWHLRQFRDAEMQRRGRGEPPPGAPLFRRGGGGGGTPVINIAVHHRRGDIVQKRVLRLVLSDSATLHIVKDLRLGVGAVLGTQTCPVCVNTCACALGEGGVSQVPWLTLFSQ